MNFVDPYGLIGLDNALKLVGGFVIDVGAVAGGVAGAAVAIISYPGQTAGPDDDMIPLPPYVEAKGERNWEKGRGDDPYWDLSPEELEKIEKETDDPRKRDRAKRIRKQKRKNRKTPCN